MYKCYADAMGNMPCDNGVWCDKCAYMDVKIINNYLYPDNWEACDDVEEWEENILNDIDALNDIFNL